MFGERVHMEPLHRLTAVPLPFQGRHLSVFLKEKSIAGTAQLVKLTSPERGGEPAKLVEGFFCGIFYMM